MNNNLPLYFDQMFVQNQPQHNYNTRNQNVTFFPDPNHSTISKSVRYFVPRVIMNSVPLILNKLTTHSYHGFSRYVKHHFIQSYEVTCEIANCYICSY